MKTKNYDKVLKALNKAKHELKNEANMIGELTNSYGYLINLEGLVLLIELENENLKLKNRGAK